LPKNGNRVKKKPSLHASSSAGPAGAAASGSSAPDFAR